MSKRNFLLGKGERLTEDIVVRSGGAPKAAPYTFAEARASCAEAGFRRQSHRSATG